MKIAFWRRPKSDAGRTPAAAPTKRQCELLGFIYAHQRERGYAPTLAEMAEAMKVKSRGMLVPMLRRLEELGHIRRNAGRARGIEVLRVPSAVRRAADTPSERGAA